MISLELCRHSVEMQKYLCLARDLIVEAKVLEKTIISLTAGLACCTSLCRWRTISNL